MCKILSRIKTLADTEGITIGSIERAIGASRGVISKAIAKGTDIQSKWLELICEKFPQYSPIWLLTGQGSMLTDDSKENSSAKQKHSDHPTEIIFTNSTQKLSQTSTEDSVVPQLIKEIKELAIENGRLKERIAQLEHAKNASSESFETARRDLSPSTVNL